MPENLESFKFQNRYGSQYGKPGFPEDTDTYSIQDYIGEDSPGFFYILKLDPSFLYEPASRWESLDSYKHAKKVVKNLKVVNDAAERGVQSAKDLKDDAKLELRYQNLLQVVELDKAIVPNQRKSKQRFNK